MRGLQIIPYGTRIDFVGVRKIAYGLFVAIIVGSFLSLFTRGLNLGIDFKGGLLLEIRTPQVQDMGALRSNIKNLGLGDPKLQEFGSDRDFMIRLDRQKGGEEAQALALNKIKETLGEGVEYRRVETVGPKVSEDLVHNGLIALAFCLLGMMAYIWARFEWQYGLCAILALAHDAIAVMGFYSLSSIEFSETALVAILTTIGYSINDSVVIYDRLRENLRKYKKTPMEDLINLTANETLSRTLLTSGSTLIALAALYFFGGTVIENFSLPILVGIFVGTVSSIFISANLLLYFDLRRNKDPENVDQESTQP
jgi:preprotein translocase subunit SecF